MNYKTLHINITLVEFVREQRLDLTATWMITTSLPTCWRVNSQILEGQLCTKLLNSGSRAPGAWLGRVTRAICVDRANAISLTPRAVVFRTADSVHLHGRGHEHTMYLRSDTHQTSLILRIPQVARCKTILQTCYRNTSLI